MLWQAVLPNPWSLPDMALEFDDSQMNAMLDDDQDFADYFTQTIMPKHLPVYADMANDWATPQMVINGRRYAEHLGFEDPVYQIHFVVLMWKISANFFEFEPFKTILADRSQSEETRMERCNLEPTYDEDVHATMKGNSNYWSPESMRNNILGVPYDEVYEELEEDMRRNGFIR